VYLRGIKWWEAGEDCIMRSFTKYYYDVQIKDEIQAATFLSLKYKYSPQHPGLKQPQSIFIP
jgi:hypothetical protein